MATRLTTAILALGVASTGCVNTGTNDTVAKAALARLHEVQAARDQTEAQLRDARKRIAVCETAMDGLQKQLDFQAKQRNDLAAVVYRLNLSEGSTVTEVEWRDVYQAQLRDANGRIAALEEGGKSKDEQIASLVKETQELAEILRQLIPPCACGPVPWRPALRGRVVHVNGNLCSISLTESPENAEVKPGYRFAIYDGNNYKGEARVTNSDKQRNIVFCTIEIKKGDIMIGDVASTNLER